MPTMRAAQIAGAGDPLEIVEREIPVPGVLTEVHSMNEGDPLEKVSEAYERMISGKARFRVVLTMGR